MINPQTTKSFLKMCPWCGKLPRLSVMNEGTAYAYSCHHKRGVASTGVYKNEASAANAWNWRMS